MPQRTLTDAQGSRWDVKEEPGQGADDDFKLSFRHEGGRYLEARSDRGVNALSDRELLDMLAERSGEPELTE